jgi:hypothetical protein
LIRLIGHIRARAVCCIVDCPDVTKTASGQALMKTISQRAGDLADALEQAKEFAP